MTEASFTTQLLKWFKARNRHTCVFEVKICKGPSLPFSSVKDHQEAALYHAKNNCIIFKIPDFGGQNPFDGFMMDEVAAYVVIFYYTPRAKNHFYLIPIDTWIEEKQASTRKSLTEDRAAIIGMKYALTQIG